MLWIDAATITASMVDMPAFRDFLPSGLLIDVSMSVNR